jgi:hypothetical protein
MKEMYQFYETHALYTILYAFRTIVSNEKNKCAHDPPWELWIPRTIHNANSVPIGLGTVGHKANKVWMWDTMAGHHVVENLPEENLGILILRLKITA